MHPTNIVTTPTPTTRPAISVIIPAYNEAGRLGATLDRLLEHPILGRCRRETDGPATVELIVVDDGSTDATAEISERHLTGHPLARTIASPENRGKGHAIRLGARHATGDLILFMDADLATSLDAVAPMLARLATADVVIGSREMRGAIVTGRSRGRSAMHRAFSAQARSLTRVGVSDPQCGFKGFRREAAVKLFSRSLVNGYTFDVEVLLIARKMGLTIAEIPVTWHAMGGSKIRPLRDPLSMAADMARVRYRHRGRRGDVLEVVPEPVAA